MTREEAIRLLDLNREHLRNTNNIGLKDDIEALNMAIKALSQEPTSEMVHVETLHQVMWERDIAIGQLKELGYDFGQKIEPCTDAVSRKAVLDMIEREQFKGDAISEIEKLPSVQPTADLSEYSDKLWRIAYERGKAEARQSGEWIADYGNVKCSICGHTKDAREVGKNTHYCEFCGAKMVEPQESEEQTE